MEVQKIFVNKDLTASIKCPVCGNIQSFDVGKFKGKCHSIKVKCTCDMVFPVAIDFRKSFRKVVNLPGFYARLPHHGTWSNMNVVNLSMCGLAINPAGGHNIKKGEKLRVKFILDNKEGSLYEKDVEVVNLKERQIGCEFNNAPVQDKKLVQYLVTGK